jgi:transposase
MHTTPSWEQQPDEPAHTYEAARTYFDLGPRRSLRQAAQQCQISQSTLTRWSARYGWVERARAYDAYRLKLEDEERKLILEEAARTEAQKWHERMSLEREEEWHTAQALLAKAREMLSRPLEDTKWNWRDAGVMIDQAARLVRTAAGPPEPEDEDTPAPALTVRVEYAEEPPPPDEQPAGGEPEQE